MSIDLATLSRGAVWLRAKDVDQHYLTTWVDRLGLHNGIPKHYSPELISGATPVGGKALRFTNYSSLDLGRVFDDPRNTPIATASTTYPYYASYLPSNALEGPNGSQSWATAYGVLFPQWWQITFPTAKTLTVYSLKAANELSWNIKSWTLQGSNNNFTTYDVLDTQDNIVDWDTYPLKTYHFDNTTPYLAYRIYITESNSDTNAIAAIGEFNCGENVIDDVDVSTNSYEAWIVLKGTPNGYSPNGLWRWTDAESYMAYGDGSDEYTWVYDPFCADNYMTFYNADGPANSLKKWRVYRVTYDNGYTKMYLDGKQIASSAAVKMLTNHVLIGQSRYGYGDYYFSGYIAEVYARSKVSSVETAKEILQYLQGEHILATVTGSAPVRIKSRYKVGEVPELTGTAPVDVKASSFSIQASTVDAIAGVFIFSETQFISDFSGYPGEASEILISTQLSGALDPILPPPVPPVDFAGLADPTHAPTLTASDTINGHLPTGTYRYRYAAWKGTPSQATAPSPSADISITSSAGLDFLNDIVLSNTTAWEDPS